MRGSASPQRDVRVLLARHPETLANRERRYISVTDSPYTPRGVRQAGALARRIAAFRPGAVFASPARRARVPAEDASLALGIPLNTSDDLAEVGWGDAEGLTYTELRKAGVPMDYLGGPTAGRIAGGGETWESFASRVDRAADRIVAAADGGRAAVVTHGGVMRALIVGWLDLPAEAAWHFAIPPGCVTILRLHDGFGTLEAFAPSPSAATD